MSLKEDYIFGCMKILRAKIEWFDYRVANNNDAIMTQPSMDSIYCYFKSG